MYASRYNLDFQIQDEEKVILNNALSGAVDIVEDGALNVLKLIKKGEDMGDEYGDLIKNLMVRGYVFKNKEEEDNVIKQMSKKLDEEMAIAPENFVISTTYTCNMRCKYCFQSTLPPDVPAVISKDMINRAFEFMVNLHRERGAKGNSLLTIYGGEPLQEGEDYKKAIRQILGGAQKENYGVVIITNGISLAEYCSNILCEYEIKEIHVTLDGVKSKHNRRRPLANGEGSFEKIIEGIDIALDHGFKINLRFVADSDNVDALPELVDFMCEKGWVDMPHFTPHMGRICCGCPGEYTHNIMTTDHLIEKLLEFYKTNERVRKIIPIRCMGLDRLCNTGKPYPPIFASCPGAKIEYALDAYGNLYPCSASMGKKEFQIGRYYPDVEFNERIDKWRSRSIFSNSECANCKVSLYCGGGCPIEAFLEKGSFEASSCRPVLSILKLGFNYFYPNLQEIAKDNASKKEMGCC